MSDDGFALECTECRFRFPGGMTVGLLAAHFETEHGTDTPTLELVVLCPRCDRAMTHERSDGHKEHFACEPCHRSRVVSRKDRP